MEEEERQQGLFFEVHQDHGGFRRGSRGGSILSESLPPSPPIAKKSVRIAETESQAAKAKQASVRVHEARNKAKIKVISPLIF